MKHILGILVAVFAFSFTANAQLINVNGYQQILNPVDAEEVPEGLKAIQFKKYLTKDYKPAHVDDFDQKAFLRYNIHEDQMEFVKGDNIYYLKKDVGRKVRFDNNQSYIVYNFEGEPHFFLSHVEGKNKLVARQIVKFVEERKAETAYDRDKPADYKRKKDELYIQLDGQEEFTKVPRKKKDFYAMFGSKTSDVKAYMKKNKLGYKNVEDLKQVITFYNTL
jgi:hypothetical protein